MLTMPLVGGADLNGTASGDPTDLRFNRLYRASPTGLMRDTLYVKHDHTERVVCSKQLRTLLEQPQNLAHGSPSYPPPHDVSESRYQKPGKFLELAATSLLFVDVSKRFMAVKPNQHKRMHLGGGQSRSHMVRASCAHGEELAERK
eukprot:5821199-Pleurochrysis_carterae.AAC.1